MRQTTLAILILILAALACTKATPTPNALGTQTPTVVVQPTPNATPIETEIIPNAFPTPHPLTITGNVYVRNIPDGTTVSSLMAGDETTGACAGKWCQIPNGWIWRGCTNDNPEALGCEPQ